jgi:hypothetical protein
MLDGEALFSSPQRWVHHVLDSDSINLMVSLLAAVV